MSEFPSDFCVVHGGESSTVDCALCIGKVKFKTFCAGHRERVSQKEAHQKTGGSVDYYKCHVADPISKGEPYTAESIDIIEALGMTFAEGEAFKAIWRTCTGRMGGAVKADNKALYNAEKVEFFGARMVRAAKRSEAE